LKRLIIAALIIFSFLLTLTASASTAGTAGDPLVTLSYLDGSYADSLIAEMNKILGAAEKKAIGKLDDIYGEYAGYSFSPSFIRIPLSTGDTLMLRTGSSFILQSGSAALSLVNGTVINISTGKESAEGTRLSNNNRYFCAEDTIAYISFSGSSPLAINT